ncbi:MAG: zinc ribbon domain-containing protein [Pseudorhodoplanes sp.]|nr:zinc ribbon domain-containing protein [Pseudorhodoplanes sp.]
MSPDDILQIADDALGLRGEEDVEQVTNQLSADALFALAAAVDAIRFRYHGEWLYRQLPSNQLFTLQDLNDQLRLGLENADPRWSVAMAAALLPAGTFSIATDLAGGLSELAAAGGFVEYADNEKTLWRPGDRLQELAAEWLAPISALMLESVATDKAGSAIARDCCALVRGHGPLTLLDFGKAVRGEQARIAMSKVEPEEAYKRLLSGLMTPEPVSAAAKQTVANAKADRDAAVEAHTGLGAREQQASKPGEAVAASAAVAATGSRPSGSERSNAVETAPQRKFCAACGTPVRPEARFCHQCGNAY